VLGTLGVTGATAVGHSFGADVAVELAQRSGRVAALVIVCQAPDYSDAILPRAGALMTVPILGGALAGVGKALAAGLGGVARRTGRPALPPLAQQGIRDFRALDPAMFRVVLVQRRDRMAAHPLDAQVRETGKPTLAILGGRDHFYGQRSAERYRAAGAQVEILPDAGHSPLVEFPDATAELIAGFALLQEG
jgi:pimeloyl-ACP methyl ester carboxylesterase